MYSQLGGNEYIQTEGTYRYFVAGGPVCCKLTTIILVDEVCLFPGLIEYNVKIYFKDAMQSSQDVHH
jgi:hypothetical protein